jgi:hypothetical protein
MILKEKMKLHKSSEKEGYIILIIPQKGDKSSINLGKSIETRKLLKLQ